MSPSGRGRTPFGLWLSQTLTRNVTRELARRRAVRVAVRLSHLAKRAVQQPPVERDVLPHLGVTRAHRRALWRGWEIRGVIVSLPRERRHRHPFEHQRRGLRGAGGEVGHRAHLRVDEQPRGDAQLLVFIPMTRKTRTGLNPPLRAARLGVVVVAVAGVQLEDRPGQFLQGASGRVHGVRAEPNVAPSARGLSARRQSRTSSSIVAGAGASCASPASEGREGGAGRDHGSTGTNGRCRRRTRTRDRPRRASRTSRRTRSLSTTSRRSAGSTRGAKRRARRGVVCRGGARERPTDGSGQSGNERTEKTSSSSRQRRGARRRTTTPASYAPIASRRGRHVRERIARGRRPSRRLSSFGTPRDTSRARRAASPPRAPGASARHVLRGRPRRRTRRDHPRAHDDGAPRRGAPQPPPRGDRHRVRPHTLGRDPPPPSRHPRPRPRPPGARDIEPTLLP